MQSNISKCPSQKAEKGLREMVWSVSRNCALPVIACHTRPARQVHLCDRTGVSHASGCRTRWLEVRVAQIWWLGDERHVRGSVI